MATYADSTNQSAGHQGRGRVLRNSDLVDFAVFYMFTDDRTRRVIRELLRRLQADGEYHKRGPSMVDEFRDYMDGGEWPTSCAA